MKRINDLKEAEMRRSLADLYLNLHFAEEGFPCRIMPLVHFDPDQIHERSKFSGSHGRMTRTGLTRVLVWAKGMGSHSVDLNSVLIEYRFFPDPFYLKLPSDVRSVGRGFEYFKDRFFLPLKTNKEVIIGYHPPIQIGAIPELTGRVVEHCFSISEAEGNKNRMDCHALSMAKIDWNNPVGGGKDLLGENVGLARSLFELAGDEEGDER